MKMNNAFIQFYFYVKIWNGCLYIGYMYIVYTRTNTVLIFVILFRLDPRPITLSIYFVWIISINCYTSKIITNSIFTSKIFLLVWNEHSKESVRFFPFFELTFVTEMIIGYTIQKINYFSFAQQDQGGLSRSQSILFVQYIWYFEINCKYNTTCVLSISSLYNVHSSHRQMLYRYTFF